MDLLAHDVLDEFDKRLRREWSIETGLIALIAYLLQGAQATLLQTGDFQINYEEPLETERTRFSNWLERVIVAGLRQWRRTL